MVEQHARRRRSRQRRHDVLRRRPRRVLSALVHLRPHAAGVHAVQQSAAARKLPRPHPHKRRRKILAERVRLRTLHLAAAPHALQVIRCEGVDVRHGGGCVQALPQPLVLHLLQLRVVRQHHEHVPRRQRRRGATARVRLLLRQQPLQQKLDRPVVDVNEGRVRVGIPRLRRVHRCVQQRQARRHRATRRSLEGSPVVAQRRRRVQAQHGGGHVAGRVRRAQVGGERGGLVRGADGGQHGVAARAQLLDDPAADAAVATRDERPPCCADAAAAAALGRSRKRRGQRGRGGRRSGEGGRLAVGVGVGVDVAARNGDARVVGGEGRVGEDEEKHGTAGKGRRKRTAEASRHWWLLLLLSSGKEESWRERDVGHTAFPYPPPPSSSRSYHPLPPTTRSGRFAVCMAVGAVSQ
eukprot:Rhum_TRINITY_DN11585_c0_g1::Rhum_TRINITY_DN11585_c0_g1_i1::g.45545::m.45545